MDEHDVKILKNLYDLYIELLDERKELNKSINDAITKASEKAGVKKPLIRKAFAAYKKLQDDNEDELEEVVTVFEGLKDK
jgi:tryptophanyl-tRNA synthetase